MDSALRAMIVFVVLWAMIRLSGRRLLGELTSFDFVLLLIIGGATQRALTGQDYSIANAFIIVATLISMNVLLSLVEGWFPALGKWINGVPTILVEDGHFLHWRMRRARVSEGEIMAEARRLHGLERLDQIKFAVLEASGHISIIPASPQRIASGE
jgi:uncharacterized membrane protein YcaP (DUF421 family)